MTVDERIEALAQSVELLAEMHKQTEAQIAELATQTRRFQYWTEAIILNFESRFRALSKDQEPPK